MGVRWMNGSIAITIHPMSLASRNFLCVFLGKTYKTSLKKMKHKWGGVIDIPDFA